jgi:SAM-dependent methyltransferase
MDEEHARHFDDNRKLWDEWTGIHVGSEFYDVESFVDGRRPVRIDRWEQEEVGDVGGKTLLHIQCHFGLDTLSWARLGARVTGVDFSKRALEVAAGLAERVGVDARFLRSTVYDLPEVLDERFDVVYTSRGVLGWLPSIERWAEVACGFVGSGGFLYVHEAHPFVMAVADEQEGTNPIRLGFDYWEGETLSFPVQGSYADVTAEVSADVEHGWNHGLGQILTAIARRGLRIEFLHEHRTLGWDPGWLVDVGEREWGWPPDQAGTMPLAFSLKATRPA